MKSLSEFVNEGKGYRYLAMFLKPGLGWERQPLNSPSDFKPDSDLEYWEIVDTNASNMCDPSALVAWHGKGGYWANVYDNSMNPEKAEKWATVFKGRDLKDIERKKK